MYVLQVFLYNRNNTGIPAKGSVFIKMQVSNMKNEFLDEHFSIIFLKIKWNEIKLSYSIKAWSK